MKSQNGLKRGNVKESLVIKINPQLTINHEKVSFFLVNTSLAETQLKSLTITNVFRVTRLI